MLLPFHPSILFQNKTVKTVGSFLTLVFLRVALLMTKFPKTFTWEIKLTLPILALTIWSILSKSRVVFSSNVTQRELTDKFQLIRETLLQSVIVFNGNLYFDKVLTFGLRSAAFLCQRLTSAVKYICQMLSILIVNYLDDLAGADFKDTAWRTYQELRKVLEFCGLEESVKKTCQPSAQMVLWVFCLTQKI